MSSMNASTSRSYNRPMFSTRLTCRFAFCLCILFLGCYGRQHANEALKPTVCDLRERPDEFGGKVVQVAGWIYSDIERFGLEESNCAVALRWPENKTQATDTQASKFIDLLKASKRNPFETDGQLFTIVQGKFETVMVRKHGQLANESGSVVGA